MRDRIFELVQLAKPGDRVSRAYDIFMVVVACMSILPILFHVKQLPEWAQETISALDVIAVYILAFDYILRWITHDIREGKRGNWRSFVRYPFTLGAIIDLLSILPSLNVLPEGFLFLRVLRVFRIFRYSKQLTTIANVFAEEKHTLGSVLALAVAYIFVTALVMFTLEGETFDTFLDALYWSTITLTTIGFGDIHPLTNLGMVITSISSIFGIFVLALPAGIMTSSFLHQLRLRSEDEEKYYSKVFIGDVQLGYFHLSPQKVKSYRKSNPKVRMYTGVIAFGVALNLLLYVITSEVFHQVIWLDTTGTAIVAFLLEPAAGIIVGFINNLILAIHAGNAGNLLYFGESAVTALAYGLLLHHAKNPKVTFASALKVLGIVIGVQSFISVGLAMLLSDGQLTAAVAQFYQQSFMDLGVASFTSTVLAVLIERTLDAVCVFGVAMFFRHLFAKPRFNPEIWLAGKTDCLSQDTTGDDKRSEGTGIEATRAKGEGVVGDDGRHDGRCADEGVVSNDGRRAGESAESKGAKCKGSADISEDTKRKGTLDKDATSKNRTGENGTRECAKVENSDHPSAKENDAKNKPVRQQNKVSALIAEVAEIAQSTKPTKAPKTDRYPELTPEPDPARTLEHVPDSTPAMPASTEPASAGSSPTTPLLARYGNAVVADTEQLKACAKELCSQADEYVGTTTSRIYEAGAVALKVIAEQDVSTPEEFQKAFELYVFRKKKNTKKKNRGSNKQESE